MKARTIAAGASLFGSAGAAFAFNQFRRELKAAKSRLEAGSSIAETAMGPIEYACEGSGEAVLAIHGAGGGYDQGLLVARNVLSNGFRLISPSRFGYLRTPVPEDRSTEAQADAHAALLDYLEVAKCIVVGISAGAPSAIDFARRYPERTSALILVVPRCYHPEIKVGVAKTTPNQAIVRLMQRGADFSYWIALKSARSRIVRFLGVPPAVEGKAPKLERAAVDALIRSLLPLSARVEGLRIDGENEPEAQALEQVTAPTLIISAKDDLYETAPAAEFTAKQIGGSELHVLEDGGHLLVGRTDEVKHLVNDFLRRRLWLRKAA